MSISPNVVIMTKDELEKIKHEWFQKGVERGAFEERICNPERNRGVAEGLDTRSDNEAGVGSLPGGR